MAVKKTGSGSGTPSNYGGVSVPPIFQSSNPATHVLLAILLQTGGLVIAVSLAGLSDTTANLIILIMVGLLLLFMIMNVTQFSGILNMLTNVEQGASA